MVSLATVSVLSYAKLQQKCHQASCRSSKHCQCQLNCHHFALVQIFDVEQNQLPTLQGRILVQHILRVKQTTKLVALPLEAIKEKCLQVALSSGTFVCHVANRFERDWAKLCLDQTVYTCIVMRTFLLVLWPNGQETSKANRLLSGYTQYMCL